jgi:hypothetical protein
MGPHQPFSRSLVVAVALGAAALAGATSAAAQSTPCGSTVETLIDHAGETPVFTGIDANDHAFTLTRNPETGAWALWAITEFTKESGGLEIGKPCVVIDGGDSKMLDAPAEEAVAAVADTPTEQQAPTSTEAGAEAETFRVTQVKRGKVLDLRTGPGTENESIRQIPSDGAGIVVGACRAVDGYRYPWCEATWDGAKGWASACCLEGERTGRRPD